MSASDRVGDVDLASARALLIRSLEPGPHSTVRCMALVIRTFAPADEAAVIALWQAAGLTRPWNDPHADIARKQTVQPELFLVGELGGEIVATALAGYDGHRGR